MLMKWLLSVVLLGSGLASSVSAATLSEADIVGGAYAASYNAPTEIGHGVTTVSGTGQQNAYDNFVFTRLPAGKQTLSFTFLTPADLSYSYSAGATILYATQPFRWGWDGITAGQVQLDYAHPSQTFDLILGDDFASNLYVALNFTHGHSLFYNITAPSNAPIAAPIGETIPAVPVPASLILVATGLMALAVVGRRRRRSVPA